LIGQDSGRGTFSHRHAVIRDQQSGEDYVPLDTLNEDAHFEVRDSLLSEEAVLAFEYGYGLAASATMGIWEAQFGDFANGAQIPIDQFLASGEEKWGQRVGLTMLLPHGYDGQGPEHSNARPERFLQLCAEGNFTVANCSTAAQYFHLLRRQGLAEAPTPLIAFTPKSLLRDPRAASPVADLSSENFQEVIVNEVEDDAAIKRVVFCTGKVYHDLRDYQTEHKRNDVVIVRLEQLYPFPRAAVNAVRERFANAEFVWCQEEPRNMGAWTFVMQRCGEVKLCPSYSGRPAAASPATGSYKRHHAEQARLLRCAFGEE
jgi:2-oxoglutarate dehydrogenase E1 component